MLEKEFKNYKEGKTRAEVVKKLEEELFELYKDSNLSINQTTSVRRTRRRILQ